jgi:molybdopterin-guanine dinucleotide biosynthesis protein
MRTDACIYIGQERIQAVKSPAIAFVGRHNSGKTTLVTKVIAELAGRGVDVGSIKHHGHCGFDVDYEGKDSWRHRQAGANEVAIASPDRMALIRELRHEVEVSELIELMEPHDVVIVEGYRSCGLPSVEIMRAANERDAVAAAEFVRAVGAGEGLNFNDGALGRDAGRMPDELTCGIASDIPEVLDAARLQGMQSFGLDDAAGIADYVQSQIIL